MFKYTLILTMSLSLLPVNEACAQDSTPVTIEQHERLVRALHVLNRKIKASEELCREQTTQIELLQKEMKTNAGPATAATEEKNPVEEEPNLFNYNMYSIVLIMLLSAVTGMLALSLKKLRKKINETDNELKAVKTKEAELCEVIKAKETELNEAIKTKETELNETIKTKEAEFNEAIKTKEAEFNEAIKTKEAELNEAIKTKGAELNEAIKTKGAELNEAIKQSVSALQQEKIASVEKLQLQLANASKLLSEQFESASKSLSEQGHDIKPKVKSNSPNKAPIKDDPNQMNMFDSLFE